MVISFSLLSKGYGLGGGGRPPSIPSSDTPRGRPRIALSLCARYSGSVTKYGVYFHAGCAEVVASLYTNVVNELTSPPLILCYSGLVYPAPKAGSFPASGAFWFVRVFITPGLPLTEGPEGFWMAGQTAASAFVLIAYSIFLISMDIERYVYV